MYNGEMVHNAPEERVKEVDLQGYVDSNHAGEKQGGLVLGFHLLEYSTNPMVLQETGHDRDVYVWSGFYGHGDFNGDHPSDKV